MARFLKIAITGASGMLGSAILDCLDDGHSIFATSRTTGYRRPGVQWRQFDLLDKEKLTRWLIEIKPDVVIHCAAIINVDSCERESILAEALHVGSTAVINDTIADWNGRLIYISTDSIFDGKQETPYQEEDPPNPLNVYGRTKHRGELAVLKNPDSLVLRTNIFGWSQAERISFAEWILKGLVEKLHLTMFADVSFTPIHVSHVAEVICKILSSNITGLFHLTGNSILSKYDFTLKMASIFGLSAENVTSSSINDVHLIAPRPKNMALANHKLCTALDYQLPTIDDGIKKLKAQYDNGWLAKIKHRAVKPGYVFWERK
ncbi:MAG: hypothetical protein A3F11_03110 [Gammaproteobacteria bacterium RIFCSPHIGHO2_12_FULL_37_14]|nr:MAG: hypothetical protein A3F11_03110 [Gammaproteobacteria bacterium RIFCSPHIGHO2_12_FULL_37_14]